MGTLSQTWFLLLPLFTLLPRSGLLTATFSVAEPHPVRRTRRAPWAGIDAGKELHWAHILNASGEKLLSRKVTNAEADLSALIDEALTLTGEIVWAIDQPGGGAALLLGLRGRGTRRSSTTPASPWIAPARPTPGNPRPMRATLTSSPTRLG